jgi:hypothetical protein
MSKDPLRDQLANDVERVEKGFPDRWDPEEPGDMIIGELVTVDRNIKTQYGPIDVATIHDEDLDEARSVWLARTVLQNEWEEVKPRPGERVGVAYLGHEEGDEGDPGYHRYSVRVDRADDGRENRLQPAQSSSSQGGSGSTNRNIVKEMTDETWRDIVGFAEELTELTTVDNTKKDWIVSAAKSTGYSGRLKEMSEADARDVRGELEERVEKEKISQEDNGDVDEILDDVDLNETEDDIPF